jgi:hypothetical protein
MNNKQIEPIIESTKKALTPLHEVKPLKPKMKRAKPLKYDTGEKNWNKQIDDIIAGKMDTKENKHQEKR